MSDKQLEFIAQIHGVDSPQYKAAKLYLEGCTYRQVAKALGCAVSTAWAYVNDWEDSRRRRDRYAEQKQAAYEAKLAIERELHAVYTLLCDSYSIEETAKALSLPVERVQQIDDGEVVSPFRYTYDPRYGIIRL